MFNSLFSNTEDPSETLQGIVITVDNSDASQGVWQYKVGAGSWTDIGLVAQNAGLMLSSSSMLRFVPTSNFNGAPGSLHAHAVDSSVIAQSYTGTSRVVFDTTADNLESNVSQAAVLLSTSISAVNDAPVLTDTSLALPNVSEDPGDPTGAVGTLVSGLLGGATDTEGTVAGMAVTAVNSNGTLYYSLDNGSNWHSVSAASASASVLFSSSTRLYFKPDANFNTNLGDAFTFRAWDGTSGSATSGSTPSTADTSTNGGSSAFSSATDTVAQTIIAINDAPSFTLAGNQSVSEDAGAQTVNSFATSINANDAGQSLTSFNITTSNDAAFATLPAINTSNGQLTYTLADNWNGAVTVTVTLTDDGGTANGGVDTSAPQSFTITASSVNDAPVLSDSNPSLPNVNEDPGDPVGSVGRLVSELTAGATDAEDSVAGIAVTAINSNGTLYYSLDNGSNWHSVSAASAPASVLFSGSTRLYFKPDANYNTNLPDAFTFRAWDGTTGTASDAANMRTADTSGPNSGGSTAFSSATDTVAQTIIAINDAPSFTLAGNQSVSEDAGAQTVNSFATSINANDAGQSLTSFNITTSNDAAFATLPAIDTSNGQLTYTLADNWNGVVSVTVSLTDDGGTANGGADTSASQSFTITASAVNDAPVLADTNLSLPNVNEDPGDPVGSLGRMVSELTGGATDTEGSVAGIAVTGVNSNGTLYYSLDSGSTWHEVATAPSATDSVLFNNSTMLYFKPDTDYNSYTSDAFTFRAWDGTTGTATSGSTPSTADTSTNGASTAFSSATDDVALTILSVNDAPSFTMAGNQVVDEDAGAVTVNSFITASSTNDNGDSLVRYNITTSNDGAFATLPTIAVSGTDANRLKYQLADNWHGEVTITVTLTDNGGTANGGIDTSEPQTFTITANAVNDAPVLDNTQSPSLPNISEDAADPLGNVGQPVSSLLAGASDVEGDSLGIAVTEVSSRGTLWYSLDGGANWLSTDAAARSDSSALLLNNTALVYFQGSADEHGSITDAITFRAWDGTGTDVNPGHINGGTADTSGSNNGGSTAFSTATDTVAITILSVNDVPQFTIGADQNIQEDVDGLNTAPTQVTRPGFISGISEGFTGTTTNEGSQTLTFTVTTDNDAAFDTLPVLTRSTTDPSIADLTYTLNQDWNGGPITVTVILSDDGGTENDGVSVSQPQTFTITATAVNDAPVLGDSGLAFTHMTEDGGSEDGDQDTRIIQPSGEAGRLVSEFTGAASDIEQDDATLGIAITGVNQYMTLWYGIQSDGSNWVWNSVESTDVANNNALLLSSDARIYLQPKRDVNTGTTADHTPGTVDPIAAAITFRAWDGTNGIINDDGSNSLNGQKADTTNNGATSAYSSFVEQVSVMIDPVVDIADDTVTFIEDEPTLTNRVIDVWDNDSFDASAQITGLSSTTGANGVTVTDNGDGTYTLTDPNDPIDPDDLSQGYRVMGTLVLTADSDGVANRVLTFNPAEDWHSNGNSKTFSYTVTSENNTETATVTFTVTSVADAVDDIFTTGEDRTNPSIVPALASDNDQGFVVTASDNVGSQWAPYKAFDQVVAEPNRITIEHGSNANSWATSGTSGWIQVQLSQAAQVASYSMTGIEITGRQPTSWTLLGSTDGVTFTTIDTVSGVSWNARETKQFTVDNPGTYQYLKLDISANGGDGYTGFDALQFYGDTGNGNKDVMANDTFGPNASVNRITQGPTNGTATIEAGGTVTYTPNADFYGTDTYTYEVLTAAGNRETATVTVTVNPVVDAADDSVTISEDVINSNHGNAVPVVPTLSSGNDQGFTVTSQSAADPNGFLRAGTEAFHVFDGATDDTSTSSTENAWLITGNDGSLQIDLAHSSQVEAYSLSVLAATRAPVDWTLEGSTDEGATFTTIDTESGVTWTDDQTRTFSLDTPGIYNSLRLVITDNGGDSFTTIDTLQFYTKGPGHDINVLANDSFSDSNAVVSVASGDEPEHGTVRVNADKTITYIPDPDYYGTDSFTYTVTTTAFAADGTTPINTVTETAVVNLTINPVDDDQSGADLFTIDEDSSGTFDVLADDTFDSNAVVSVEAGDGPANGSVVVNADKTITYTPDANFQRYRHLYLHGYLKRRNRNRSGNSDSAAGERCTELHTACQPEPDCAGRCWSPNRSWFRQQYQ